MWRKFICTTVKYRQPQFGRVKNLIERNLIANIRQDGNFGRWWWRKYKESCSPLVWNFAICKKKKNLKILFFHNYKCLRVKWQNFFYQKKIKLKFFDKAILFSLATLKLLFFAWFVILNGIICFLAKFADPFAKVGDPRKGYDP